MKYINGIKVRDAIAHRKNLVCNTCAHCNEQFLADPCMIRKGGGVFCEFRCYMAARKKGTRLEQEYRLVAKKRKTQKGRKQLAAYHQVRKAIKEGRLIKTNCQSCMDAGKPVEAHHDDYDKPLEVRWLCRQCHNDVHKFDRVNWRKQIQN